MTAGHGSFKVIQHNNINNTLRLHEFFITQFAKNASTCRITTSSQAVSFLTTGLILVHGQVTIIFVESVCLFVCARVFLSHL